MITKGQENEFSSCPGEFRLGSGALSQRIPGACSGGLEVICLAVRPKACSRIVVRATDMLRDRFPHLRAILQALFVTLLWSTSWVLVRTGRRDIPTSTFGVEPCDAHPHGSRVYQHQQHHVGSSR